MGMLYVLDANHVDTSSSSDWELLCEATGDEYVLEDGLCCEAGSDKSG